MNLQTKMDICRKIENGMDFRELVNATAGKAKTCRKATGAINIKVARGVLYFALVALCRDRHRFRGSLLFTSTGSALGLVLSNVALQPKPSTSAALISLLLLKTSGIAVPSLRLPRSMEVMSERDEHSECTSTSSCCTRCSRSIVTCSSCVQPWKLRSCFASLVAVCSTTGVSALLGSWASGDAPELSDVRASLIGISLMTDGIGGAGNASVRSRSGTMEGEGSVMLSEINRLGGVAQVSAPSFIHDKSVFL